MKTWSAMAVMNFCIRHNLYTGGDCRSYDRMLDYVREHEHPTEEDIEKVCIDIICHSPEFDIFTTSIQKFIQYMKDERVVREG